MLIQNIKKKRMSCVNRQLVKMFASKEDCSTSLSEAQKPFHFSKTRSIPIRKLLQFQQHVKLNTVRSEKNIIKFIFLKRLNNIINSRNCGS